MWQYGFTWDGSTNIYWFDNAGVRDRYADELDQIIGVPVRKYVNRSGVRFANVTAKTDIQYDYIMEE